jgi:hypothetical protein
LLVQARAHGLLSQRDEAFLQTLPRHAP